MVSQHSSPVIFNILALLNFRYTRVIKKIKTYIGLDRFFNLLLFWKCLIHTWNYVVTPRKNLWFKKSPKRYQFSITFQHWYLSCLLLSLSTECIHHVSSQILLCHWFQLYNLDHEGQHRKQLCWKSPGIGSYCLTSKLFLTIYAAIESGHIIKIY